MHNNHFWMAPPLLFSPLPFEWLLLLIVCDMNPVVTVMQGTRRRDYPIPIDRLTLVWADALIGFYGRYAQFFARHGNSPQKQALFLWGEQYHYIKKNTMRLLFDY